MTLWGKETSVRESRWYLCKNCECHFKSPLYRQLCFVCGGDEYQWTAFEKVFAAVVMAGLLLAMVFWGCQPIHADSYPYRCTPRATGNLVEGCTNELNGTVCPAVCDGTQWQPCELKIDCLMWHEQICAMVEKTCSYPVRSSVSSTGWGWGSWRVR